LRSLCIDIVATVALREVEISAESERDCCMRDVADTKRVIERRLLDPLRTRMTAADQPLLDRIPGQLERTPDRGRA
jgi:hypothetical protein